MQEEVRRNSQSHRSEKPPRARTHIAAVPLADLRQTSFGGTAFACGNARSRVSWLAQPKLARRQDRPAFAKASAGILRLNHERKMMDQLHASWNRLASWLRQIDGLRRAT